MTVMIRIPLSLGNYRTPAEAFYPVAKSPGAAVWVHGSKWHEHRCGFAGGEWLFPACVKLFLKCLTFIMGSL